MPEICQDLSIPLNTISNVYHERCIPRGVEIDSPNMLAYLRARLDWTEHIFVLDGLPRTERFYLPDKGLNLRRTLFLFTYSQNPRPPPVRYFECIDWTWRIRLLSLVPSISSWNPRDASQGPSSERFSSCSFPPGSLACFSVPFFYEKARISLIGSSKRRRPRNSRWATSIFLLKINGHADTRKKKN